MGLVSLLNYPCGIFSYAVIRKPSPPSAKRMDIVVGSARPVWFPEAKMNEIRGIDATLYIRFLRGCCTFPSSL